VTAFGIAWLAVDTVRAVSKLIVMFAAIVVIVAASPVLAMYGVLFEPLSVCTAAVMSCAAGVLYSRTESGRRKLLFLQVTGKRVSRQTMADLARTPFGVSISGENRAVTVLVCRIVNCRDLLGKLRTREAIDLFNHFLREASEFLLERGGYLDEWGFDEVRFYFGLPLIDEFHADTACRAAFDLKVHLEAGGWECEDRRQERLEWGIAVVSAEMTVGLCGSGPFTRFSALGEQSGLARSLCALSMNFGPAVLVSGNTLRQVRKLMEFRLIDMLHQAEDKKPVEVHELLTVNGELADEEIMRRDAFSRGMTSFREGDYVSSLEHFETARPPLETDRPLEYYRILAKQNIERGNDSDYKVKHADMTILL
jgi:class 3 adenylate cyclase